MALTREFKETVMQLCSDPQYRRALLLEALESYLEGEVAVGNALLRDYLNGTQSFVAVSQALRMQESGLRRMLSANGNATAKNLFRLFRVCQQREGIVSSREFLELACD
ncbi:MAG TPA: transcriptional regulator [Orrella sp.]